MTRSELLERLAALSETSERIGDAEAASLFAQVAALLAGDADSDASDSLGQPTVAEVHIDSDTVPEMNVPIHVICTWCGDDGMRCPVCQPD